MLKCFYSDTFEPPRCDKEADYIYLGKSYCAEHVEIRGRENNPPQTIQGHHPLLDVDAEETGSGYIGI